MADSAADGPHHDDDAALLDPSVLVHAQRLVDDEPPEAGVEVGEGVPEDLLDVGVLTVDPLDDRRVVRRGAAAGPTGPSGERPPAG
ncbi:hypothetical protein [Streptomyces roseolilacinus]|uniref:Uncharacterized protein n=1 Tax=Streptomyces roseolilacinus TaxID=66904 RepID=A0A918AYN3_9ACTN|nr:hypothetical protein [Streptomyces roseolilacinus]GGQ01570.1 hypothetical protein GCM10010249_20010 [Streptomyces roseolilacinus]